MKRKLYQFHVRIDEELNTKIEMYLEYIVVKTKAFINLSEYRRLILRKGIDQLILEEGGIEEIKLTLADEEGFTKYLSPEEIENLKDYK